MRRKKTKEQFIAIITLCSVFIFFIYLKMNPEISSTSLNSKLIENDKLEKDNVSQIQIDGNFTENDKPIIAAQKSDYSDSIIEYTESELKRAESYFNRDWKPDHTINLTAWKYVSKISLTQDEKILKDIDLDMEKSQVVNVIK